MTGMAISPGWYPDPAAPQTQRYWDGEGWIGEPLPAEATPPDGPPEVKEPEPVQEAVASLASPDEQTTQETQKHAPSPYATMRGPQSPNKTPQGDAVSATYIAVLAPRGFRLGARIIDFTAVLLLNIVVNGWFVWQFLKEIYPSLRDATRDYQVNGTMGTVDLTDRAQRLALLITVIWLLLWLAYEVPAMMNSGQTMGKRLVGVKVVSLTTGTNPRFGQSFRRWGLFALPMLFPLLCSLPLQALDAAWCMWDRPARQCGHDKFASTVVVRTDMEMQGATP
ncbi:MAG: RDD family protein [Corynebacteriales bacterium]|nr:RDD family protein [Mycobacteriales bacterium]